MTIPSRSEMMSDDSVTVRLKIETVRNHGGAEQLVSHTVYPRCFFDSRLGLTKMSRELLGRVSFVD